MSDFEARVRRFMQDALRIDGIRYTELDARRIVSMSRRTLGATPTGGED